jgi:hypothetical protein
MNVNTVVNALQEAGVALNSPITLTNPGGNNPWLFTWPAGFVFNAGGPVALNVPCVQGEAVDLGSRAGIALSGREEWYADGRPFIVRAHGLVAPLTFSKTFRIYLFVGNGVNPASAGGQQDYELGLLSATLPASTTAYSNWYLEAKCLWDSASLQLNGQVSGQIGGSVISATGFSINNPTSWVAQQAAGSYNPLSFVLGVNLASTAGPNNDVVTLNELYADMV